MRRTRVSFCLRFLLLACLFPPLAPQIARGAWPRDPATNVPVCTVSSNQDSSVMVPDGSGGAIVVWQDWRNGNPDIYAQHITAGGILDPAWLSPGFVAVATGSWVQNLPSAVPDGAGGVIVAWQDTRVGVFSDVYAQHVTAAGLVDPAWPPGGLAVCTAAGDQWGLQGVSDGAGGAIFTWYDSRTGSDQDIYAQRLTPGGTVDPSWPVNGLAICTAAGWQSAPVIATDGASGAIIAWADARGGGNDIYSQHALSNGTVDPAWPVNGRALCTAAGNQYGSSIVSDGAGGAIVAWHDSRTPANWFDVYAQRVTASGTPAWAADGIAVCAVGGDNSFPQVVADGAGGAIIAWMDARPTGTTPRAAYVQRLDSSGSAAWAVNGVALSNLTLTHITYIKACSDGAGGAIVTWPDTRTGSGYRIYSQRVTSSGAVAWAGGGVQVSSPAGQDDPRIVADGLGGAILAWTDSRNGNWDIYAQRIAGSGHLGGEPHPSIVGARDVPNDQGGVVRLSWNASGYDTDPPTTVDSYLVFREAPASLALHAIAAGGRLLGARDVPNGGGREFVRTARGVAGYYWEYLGSVASRALSGYSYLAATTGDSVSGSNPRTLFMVRALRTSSGEYWDSAPDSGYSVDNLAPAAPVYFSGRYLGSATGLHWMRNTETDLKAYRLYRGASAAFVPGPANLVTEQPDTGFVDHVDGSHFYKLAAVDIHGNVSPFATLTPKETGAVPGEEPHGLWLGRAKPNPSSAGVRIEYGLARAGHVRLAVYDAQGRLVRTLVEGPRIAGNLEAAWDGRDGAGRDMGSGAYFYRLETGGRVLAGRLALIR